MPASTSGKPVRPCFHASSSSAGPGPLEVAVALLELEAGHVREVHEHRGVEVAPGQLGPVVARAAAGMLRDAPVELERGDAAPAQVGGQARRAARRQVPPVGVGPQVGAEEAREPPPPGGLARLGRGVVEHVGGVQAEVGQGRQVARGRPGRRVQLGRRVDQGTPLGAQPRAGEGGEDRVGAPLLRADRRRVVDDAAARGGVDLDADAAQRVGHPRVAGPGPGRDVRGQVDGGRADLARQPRELVLRTPPPDEEAGATLPQRGVELAQAAEHERRPDRAGEATAGEQAVVEDEQRDQPVRARGGRERGEVVQPQVAPEPHDRRRRGHPRATGGPAPGLIAGTSGRGYAAAATSVARTPSGSGAARSWR